MSQQEEIVLWIDQRWKRAIEKHLNDETLQEHLENVLDELCNQLPEREYERISRAIQSEAAAQRAEEEAARTYAAYHVTERGQEWYFKTSPGEELLTVGKKLRSYITSEKAAVPDLFIKMFAGGRPITAEEYNALTAVRMQLEMGSYTEIRTQVGVLEVNFCINGRFETSFSMRSHVLLKPGDMAISCYDGLHGTKSESHFPLGYYEGLCLEIDPAAAGHWIRLNAPAFPIDFTALKQNLLGSKWYMVGPAGPRCEHVFRELYESASYAESGFLQLKVLELMLLLGRIPQERAADPYCSAEQTALAHHLRDHLLTNREGYVSLAQLAAEHAISVSHLQKLFKQTYGMPVYHYIKEYRLEQAAVELVRNRKPITEIAQHAGYDNASKFSESFKKRYGKTPSRYRADKTNAVKRSIETKTE